MKERAGEKGFGFPYLYDETQEVARAYGAERTPEVFVFDRVRGLRYPGAIDDHYVDAILAGQQPPVQETAPVGCTVRWKAEA